MKKFYYSFIILLVVGFSTTTIGQTNPFDTLSMGPGYINDIYYSLENGEVGTAPRNNWDIAFYTARFSAGVISNEGNGLEVYAYPNGDTTAWATIDTAGMASWTPLYNSSTVWEDGAFNKNASGDFDYGWGVYNTVTHNLTGKLIYVLNIPNVGIKKLWIVEKLSVDNIYLFRYANLDGSNFQEVTLDINPYTAKRFIYYSLVTNEAVDREPDAESYDIQFTKYMEAIGEEGHSPTYYPVTGVTNNVDIASNNFHPVAPDFNNWSSKPLDSLKNAIGYDWKVFDLNTYTYTIVDSNYYFIKNYAGDIYRLKFLSWGGSQTGNFSLTREVVSYSSIGNNFSNAKSFDVYPNPATEHFTIKADDINNEFVTLTIYDQAGRKTLQENVSASQLSAGYSVANIGLTKGLYIVSLSGDKTNISQKLMIK